jgi:hypothetical protein
MTKIHICSPFTNKHYARPDLERFPTPRTSYSLHLEFLSYAVLETSLHLLANIASYLSAVPYHLALQHTHSPPGRSANCFDPPHAVVLPTTTTTKAAQRHPATARQHPLLGLLQLLLDCSASATLETSDHVQTVVQTSNHQSRIPPDGPPVVLSPNCSSQNSSA